MGAEAVNPLVVRTPPPWLALGAAAVAFGVVEAVLVTAYRRLLDPSGQLFPLVALPAALAGWERLREAATLVLLGAIGTLARRHCAARAGAFCFVFGLWDITYYAVLRGSLGWPRGLGDWDLLFLLPVPWLAPVYAPLVLAALLVAAGATVLHHDACRGDFQIHAVHVVAAAIGGLLCVWSCIENDAARSLLAVPARYAVEYLVIGIALAAGAFADAVRRNRRPRRLR